MAISKDSLVMIRAFVFQNKLHVKSSFMTNSVLTSDVILSDYCTFIIKLIKFYFWVNIAHFGLCVVL